MASKKYASPHRIRKKRSFIKILFRSRLLWFSVGNIVLFSLILYGIAFTPLVRVRAIEVAGNEFIKKEDLTATVEKAVPRNIFFFESRSFLLIRKEYIERILKEDFPEILNVSIERKIFQPGIIEITIEERKGVATWCVSDDQCFIADKEGVIFLKANLQEKNYVHLFAAAQSQDTKLGKQVLDQKFLSALAAFMQSISNGDFLKKNNLVISSFRVNSENNIEASTLEGWKIFLTAEGDIEWQAQKLRAVLTEKVTENQRKHLEYIDLRFGDQAYVK